MDSQLTTHEILTTLRGPYRRELQPWYRERKLRMTPKLQAKLRIIGGWDPTPMFIAGYGKLRTDQRLQNGLTVRDLWPDRPDGTCPCGCSLVPPGRRRYATDNCTALVNVAFEIIYGRPDTIGELIRMTQGYRCAECDCTVDLDLDHKIPVKHGGGASWLGNYQWLCKHHHKLKTARDFGHKTTNNGENKF